MLLKVLHPSRFFLSKSSFKAFVLEIFWTLSTLEVQFFGISTVFDRNYFLFGIFFLTDTVSSTISYLELRTFGDCYSFNHDAIPIVQRDSICVQEYRTTYSFSNLFLLVNSWVNVLTEAQHIYGLLLLLLHLIMIAMIALILVVTSLVVLQIDFVHIHVQILDRDTNLLGHVDREVRLIKWHHRSLHLM